MGWLLFKVQGVCVCVCVWPGGEVLLVLGS